VKLLLDTHAFVWAVTADARLPDSWRTPITDRSNVVLVSAATAWEMSIKATSGKWPSAGAMLDDVERAADELGAELLPITVEHAVEAGRIEWQHRDPFDRMLAAQAIVEDAVLLTGDHAFESSGAQIYRLESHQG
jgi:PIN domain nuclease of toxin-antitoxin system